MAAQTLSSPWPCRTLGRWGRLVVLVRSERRHYPSGDDRIHTRTQECPNRRGAALCRSQFAHAVARLRLLGRLVGDMKLRRAGPLLHADADRARRAPRSRRGNCTGGPGDATQAPRDAERRRSHRRPHWRQAGPLARPALPRRGSRATRRPARTDMPDGRGTGRRSSPAGRSSLPDRMTERYTLPLPYTRKIRRRHSATPAGCPRVPPQVLR
jgi:hypothetical protein